MYHLIAIGDITLDMYFQGDTLTEKDGRYQLASGGKYYTDMFYQGLGGSGANIAIHAANLGLNSAVLAKAGENAFKNIIVQNLARKTVSTEFLFFDRNHISISTILLNKKGERTVIKYSDPKEHIEISSAGIERISKAPVIFMGNLPDIPLVERVKLLKQVKNPNNLIALNFGSKDCRMGIKKLDSILRIADILVVNRYEYADLIGKGKSAKTLTLKKNQLKVIKRDDIVLVITDGSKGSYVYSDDKVYHHMAKDVKNVKDCTGAGDAYTSSFLVKYNETKNIEKSMEYATEYASKILCKIGAN